MSKPELKASVVALFNQGDPLAFKEVFNYYYDDIFYFARKMLDNKEDAEDLAIQIFTKLFNRCDAFDTSANIKAFLFISTRNLCLNYLRDKEYRRELHKKFVEKMEVDYQLALEIHVKPDLLDAIEAAINNLPGTCQRVFRSLFFHGLKPAEVAEQLGISLDNVYSQKKRALQLLRMEFTNNSLVLGLLSLLVAPF